MIDEKSHEMAVTGVRAAEGQGGRPEGQRKGEVTGGLFPVLAVEGAVLDGLGDVVFEDVG